MWVSRFDRYFTGLVTLYLNEDRQMDSTWWELVHEKTHLLVLIIKTTHREKDQYYLRLAFFQRDYPKRNKNQKKLVLPIEVWTIGMIMNRLLRSRTTMTASVSKSISLLTGTSLRKNPLKIGTTASLCSAAPETQDRDQMHYDALVIGAGPAGLCSAIRLKQL